MGALTLGNIGQEVMIAAIFIGVLILIGMLAVIIKCYHKVRQGGALIRNGMGGTKVTFSGIVVLPVIHRVEYMDISAKRVEIDRTGSEGLVCRDNLRADIKVAFFVRVNNTSESVAKVAQSLGCVRASDSNALREFFDAKFSEALKTAGKRFDFADLYTSRVQFKEEILEIVGTDLNGYVLDDAAIDYLEQTSIDLMNPNNILDAEGIKKITELTSRERIKSNAIEREKDMTITKQDVEAREAILELQKQLAEAEQKQKREIASATAREESQAKQVQEGERLKAERARIVADEELGVAEENKQRQVIVAQRNKERTDAVELERVEKDRALEATERERVVDLAIIDKNKAIETEKREIQLVIRERVMVERNVVEEEEKIKDTKEFAGAERRKRVAVTEADAQAEQARVREVKAAQASKQAAELRAEEVVVEADANRKASERNAEAKKLLADAMTAEQAVEGMAEVRVMEAKAKAVHEYGQAEARVMQEKFHAEADGLTEKAKAMKLLDGVGKEHEEFKLRLNKDRDIELAEIGMSRDVAAEQAKVLGEAVKSAKIDIVGGDHMFFDRLVNSITRGKQVDRVVHNSQVLTNLSDSFFNGDGAETREQICKFVTQFGLSTEDLKNLTISALLVQLAAAAGDEHKGLLSKLTQAVNARGLGDKPASLLLADKVSN